MKELYYYENGGRIKGHHEKLFNTKNIWGDCTNLRGNAGNLTGDVTFVRGDVTGLRGKASSVHLYMDSDIYFGDLSITDRNFGLTVVEVEIT